MYGIGRNDKAVARTDVRRDPVDCEPKPPAFDVCRLNVGVIVQRAFCARRMKPEGNDHQVRMIGKHLSGDVFTGIDTREVCHGLSILSNP